MNGAITPLPRMSSCTPSFLCVPCSSTLVQFGEGALGSVHLTTMGNQLKVQILQPPLEAQYIPRSAVLCHDGVVRLQAGDEAESLQILKALRIQKQFPVNTLVMINKQSSVKTKSATARRFAVGQHVFRLKPPMLHKLGTDGLLCILQ